MNPEPAPDPLSSLSGWTLGLGGVLILLGLLALAAPWAAATVIDYVCAGALIAAGISQLGITAATWTWRGFWLTLLCGVLSIVAGTAMLAIPVEGIHALVTFLGLLILFEAAAKLAAAFSAPPGFPWGWILFDGIVTALLGGILLTSPAAQAGLYLGVLIGINLLSSGISFLAAGLWLRRSLG
ncbi:MAG: hypothetical protein EBZ74_09575 [Planctomycetia bacterium]|nr:hypothetical protein [Planctomycetia bacterium]